MESEAAGADADELDDGELDADDGVAVDADDWVPIAPVAGEPSV